MTRSFHNRILRVDLSNGETCIQEPGAVYLRRYMGGWNVIADQLLREVPPGSDPLGPDNKLVFAPGVLTGLPVSGTSRLAVGAKSPLTGTFGATEVGGVFGAELKRAGFDAIVIDGIAEKPTYVYVHDGTVELRDASHLWGKPTGDTLNAIQEELGDRRVRCTLIGPAGEKLVRYACVMDGTKDAGGRGGLGAVMGSKKLKAVAARGTMQLDGADPARIHEMSRWMAQGVSKGEIQPILHEVGSGWVVEGFETLGNLPIRNFRDGGFPGASKIGAHELMAEVGLGMEGCFACAVRCKKVTRAWEPYTTDPAYGGPEYESIASLGPCVGIDDVNIICKANELCNAYSLDTISTGVSIAFAMECFENGLLTLEDTGGLELRFGNGEILPILIKKIACRSEGIGDLLAEGVKRAAERIGRGAERFAMHVKGLEIPMHEPRFKRGLAIGYAVAPTGADHCSALHDADLVYADEEGLLTVPKMTTLGSLEPLQLESLGPEKVRASILWSVDWIVNDCLPICLWLPWSIEQRAELVQAATGWNVSAYELFKVGERAITLARVFNTREGFTATNDTLPDRFFGPTVGGPLASGGIDKDELQKAVHLYYGMMGWDQDTGVPTPAKLHELDVSWAIEYLRDGGTR